MTQKYNNWKNNPLGKRIVSGLIYGLILIGAIVWRAESFFALIALASTACVAELSRLFRFRNRAFPWLLGAANLNALLIVSYNYFPWPVRLYALLPAVLILLCGIAFTTELFRKNAAPRVELGGFFLGLIYISVPFSLALLIPFLTMGVYAYQIILSIFILIWTNDVFAFFTGVTFGRHKLIERISPKKSVEGFFGGLVFTFIAGIVLSFFFRELGLADWLAMAAIVSVVCVIGDLVESMFKRETGVKDSGNLIPGHGGMLDRFDSFIFSVPFVFIYLYLRFAVF